MTTFRGIEVVAVPLRNLIAEAVALGGGDLCAAGHDWESEGGRTCPKYEHANCSQTVFVCKRCGVHDYGYKGGPAHHECFSECKRDFSAEIAEDAAQAAESERITRERNDILAVERADES